MPARSCKGGRELPSLVQEANAHLESEVPFLRRKGSRDMGTQQFLTQYENLPLRL